MQHNYMQTQRQEHPLILIYYKFRGQMQPIRNLLCYMDVPFVEIHPEYLEETKKRLPSKIIEHIKKFRIDKSQLPALIHGDLYFWGQIPICIYICKLHNREDLLGTNIYMRSRLREILDIYVVGHPKSMINLLQTIDRVHHLSDQAFDEECKRCYENIFNNSKYGRVICQYLDMQIHPVYIFGVITLIDFFFIESCMYSAGICDTPTRLNYKALQEWDPAEGFLNKPNAYYMSTMKSYETGIRNQPWYLKHQDYLESFSIISIMLSDKRAKGLKKAWIGNQKCVA